MEKRNNKDGIETIEDLISSMNMSKVLSTQKDAKFNDSTIEYYLQDKKKLLPFVKEKKQQEFITLYSSFYKVVGKVPDDTITTVLLEWALFEEILVLLNSNMDLKIISKVIANQGHTYQSLNRLIYNIAYFSEHGLQLIEELFGKDYYIKAQREIDFKKYTFRSKFSIPYEKLQKFFN